MARLRIEVARERLLFGIAVAYFAGAQALALTLGIADNLALLEPASRYVCWGVLTGFVYVLLHGAWTSFHTGLGGPFHHAGDECARVLSPRIVSGFALLCAVSVFLGTFTAVKNMLPELTAYRSDRWLADLDSRLHGGIDPWRLIHPLLAHHFVTRVIETLYYGFWIALLLVSTALVAMWSQLAHLRRQFFLTFFLCWIVLGNVVAGWFLSIGPAYFGAVTGDFARFGPLDAYLTFSAGSPNSAHDVQRTLCALYSTGRVVLGSGISAFPSIHLAMATLYALLAWQIERRAGMVMTVYAAVIMVGSVHLNWHYAIDGYVSIIATLAIWALVGVGLRRSERGLTPSFEPGPLSGATAPFRAS